MRKVRLSEIVELTGLSRATVDRALNKRPGVHPRTMEVIRGAYEQLRSPEAAGAKPRAEPLPAPVNAVFRLGRGLTEQLRAAGMRLGLNLQVHDMYQKGEADIFEVVRRLCREDDRPLIVAVKNHDRVCEELAAARERGKRIVGLVSDLNPAARDVFIGIDNRMAGQTAALLIGRLVEGRSGKVGVVLGDYAFRCHEDREIGFRSYLRAAFPKAVLADVVKGEDSPDQTYRATLDLLAAHPDISAIYNLAGGNRGLADALVETGRDREVIVVTHEANGVTAPLLRSNIVDFVIAQDPAALLHEAVRAASVPIDAAIQHIFIDFGIYSCFNIPAFATLN